MYSLELIEDNECEEDKVYNSKLLNYSILDESLVQEKKSKYGSSHSRTDE